MTTLLIFSALCYLVGFFGLKPVPLTIVRMLLAVLGVVLWVLICLGVGHIPKCFTA